MKSHFDLEKLYQGYPRKKGKTPGLKKLASEIKTKEDYQSLERAINNFTRHHAEKEPRYVMHFSTFAAQWRDWINIEPDIEQYSINTTPINLEEIE